VLIVLDEAHVFAPEKGSAESTGAVIDVATRGRKRGQSLIVATQRLAKLHKDVAAEMLNKLIGRTGLDIDVKRAADELGMTPREAMEQLRPLDPGEFYAFGPALSLTVTKVAIGPVVTTHPRAGERLMQAPPQPSAKIKGLIAAELADLPQQAESEIRTIEDAKRELADVRRKLTVAQKAQPVIDSTEVPKLREEASGLRAALKTATDAYKQADARLRKIATLADVQSHDIAAVPTASASVPRLQPRPEPPKPRANGHAEPSGDLTRPQQKLLDQLAWLEEHGIYPAQKETLAAVAGVSPTSGGYFNNLGALRSQGLIVYPQSGMVGFTDEGRACAVTPDDPRPVHERWLGVVTAPQRAILETLIELHPEPITKDELAERIGVSPTSGGYFNNLGRLRTLGAVDYPQPGSVSLTRHVMP
jgi:Mn-dependent DtxR family transcriptional regulator